MNQSNEGIPNTWDRTTSRITGGQARAAANAKKRKRRRQSAFSKKTRN